MSASAPPMRHLFRTLWVMSYTVYGCELSGTQHQIFSKNYVCLIPLFLLLSLLLPHFPRSLPISNLPFSPCKLPLTSSSVPLNPLPSFLGAIFPSLCPESISLFVLLLLCAFLHPFSTSLPVCSPSHPPSLCALHPLPSLPPTSVRVRAQGSEYSLAHVRGPE